MSQTILHPPIVIMCPVCGADGTELHHDMRCSLLYFCERCNHEWQTDAGEVLPQRPVHHPNDVYNSKLPR